MKLLLLIYALVQLIKGQDICNITGTIPVGGLDCFTIDAPITDALYFDTCGSLFDTYLELYYPTDIDNRIAWDDDGSCGLDSYLSVPVDPNFNDPTDIYFLRIRPWAWRSGGEYIIQYPCSANLVEGGCVPIPDTTCDAQGQVTYLNWDIMVNFPGQGVPESNFSVEFDLSTLSVTFDVDLEYIGGEGVSTLSTKDGLGATYVLDFYSFGSDGYTIDNPGNCQNRLASSFAGITDFDDMWTYSLTPNNGGLGTNNFLAYPPPSQYWTLSATDCTPINYNGQFSWNDLVGCQDPDGNDLISVVDDGTAITLSGTFYVNVVAPYQKGAVDTGFYRSLPLVQQDFSISLLKQINVLASTGVDLFIATIIAIFETDNGNFQMSILTQSADYIELTNENALSTPLGIATMTQVTSTCLVASAFTCGQIFTLTIDESQITCNDTHPADFTGQYSMGFEVSCRNATADAAACAAFIDDNGGTPNINLDVLSAFIDTTCVAELYTVQFTGVTTFYDDDAFTQVHDPANGNYLIGQDQIYIEVAAQFPDDPNGNPYDILGVELINVFVCTAPDDADLTLDQQTGLGGCLSSEIDADGPYNIIINGVPDATYFAENIVGDGSEAYVRFSFLTFDTARTTIYVHTQLTVVLVNGARRRLEVVQTRRGMQEEDIGSNQIRHFIENTGTASEVITVDEDEDDNNPGTRGNNPDTEEPGAFDGVMIYAIAGAAVLLLCAIGVFVIMRMKKSKEADKNVANMTGVVMTTTASTTSVGSDVKTSGENNTPPSNNDVAVEIKY